MKMVNPAFGPLNHPNYTEPGPSHSRDVPLPLPPLTMSRVEQDLRALQAQRFSQLSKVPIKEPFRFYFQDLLLKSKANLASSTEQNGNDEDNANENKPQKESDPSPPIEEDFPNYPIPIPTGLTGPISLVQLMQRSRSKSGSRGTSKNLQQWQ